MDSLSSLSSTNITILRNIVQLFCKTSPNWPQLDSGYTFGAIIPQKWCGVLLSAHIRRHRMSLSPISGDCLVRWCPPGFPIVKFLLLFLWLTHTLWGDTKKHINVLLIKFCQPLTLASIHNSCHHSCKMVKKTHLSGLCSTDCNIFFIVAALFSWPSKTTSHGLANRVLFSHALKKNEECFPWVAFWGSCWQICLGILSVCLLPTMHQTLSMWYPIKLSQ